MANNLEKWKVFKRCEKQRGFTLIEMLITVAIVAILASVALPLSAVVAQHRKEQELRTALREMRVAIDAYKQATDDGRITKELEQSGYPPSLRILVDGVTDASILDGKRKIYFLRNLPRDPMTIDPRLEPENTWSLRSYESTADNPMPGKDVFDIHSKSVAIGLNGIPYNKW